MYRGEFFNIDTFSGGQNSDAANTALDLSEALAVNNIVIANDGHGFRKRNGNTAFNSSAMNSGAVLQSVSYFKTDSASEFLLSVAGTKLYSSPMTGTMTDRTGTLTITTGTDNIWSQFTFNNVHLGFGGPAGNPDAPWVWTGAGDATALTGTPPSAYGGFAANNRVFAFRTAANPSRIYWSIVGNQANWTGTGSGNADVNASDNDKLTAAAVLNTNVVLLFKENSVHQMQIGNPINSAFPIFPLFSGVGCAGKHACVVADGLAYFITSQGFMRVTDGRTVMTQEQIPHLADMDDVWSGLSTTRREYIQGRRITGADYDHIVWLVSASGGSQHTMALIWDLRNRCWIRNLTGWKANALTTTQAGIPYTAHYDGKIYKQDVSSTYTDASESSANVSCYWRSGWLKMDALEKIKQPRKMNVSYRVQAAGTIVIKWGFDFNTDSLTAVLSQAGAGSTYDSGALYDSGVYYGTVTDSIKSVRTVGRGNVFQYYIENTENSAFQVNSLAFSGKAYGQKEISAR